MSISAQALRRERHTRHMLTDVSKVCMTWLRLERHGGAPNDQQSLRAVALATGSLLAGWAESSQAPGPLPRGTGQPSVALPCLGGSSHAFARGRFRIA